MGNIFFISDTHFGQTGIIARCGRPFLNIEDMDSKLIYNWNATVKPDDVVYFLGDLSSYRVNKTREICRALNGRKILVMGNNDIFSISSYIDIGFERVNKYFCILEDKWLLSHRPIKSEDKEQYNIFGHMHNREIDAEYLKKGFCVSVERIDYKPVEFGYIKKYMCK